MFQRFGIEGYNSHNWPERVGFRGHTMKGRNQNSENAVSRSWRTRMAGEEV